MDYFKGILLIILGIFNIISSYFGWYQKISWLKKIDESSGYFGCVYRQSVKKLRPLYVKIIQYLLSLVLIYWGIQYLLK
jgi:hypothetical protein